MQNITIEDVAKAAGVSRALVSLAYRDAYGVSNETKEHILSVGKSLGYRPNRMAAALASKKATTIGVFLQDLHNDVFAGIHDGIRSVTDGTDKQTLLTVGSIDGSRDVQALETLLENRVDIVIAAGLTISDRQLKKYAGRLQLVSVMREITGGDSIVSNNVAGATEATEHLVNLGHRKIAFVSNPPSDGYLDRAQGYRAAMEAHRLEPRLVAGSYSRSETSHTVTSMLQSENPPTAIFAHNDQAALGALDAIIALGLTPGIDVSVVGYDNSSLSNAPGTSLTTVDVHGFDLGRLAAEVALSRLDLPEQPKRVVTTEPTFVQRNSTGALSQP